MEEKESEASFKLQMHYVFHVCLQIFLRPELNLVIIFFMNTAGKSNIAAHSFVSNIAVRVTKLFYSSW